MEFTTGLGGGFKPLGNVALLLIRQSSEASLIDDDAVPKGLKVPRSTSGIYSRTRWCEGEKLDKKMGSLGHPFLMLLCEQSLAEFFFDSGCFTA